MKHLLPLGSIVLLKGMKKKVMITGRAMFDEKGINYDYIACPWPVGYLPDNEFKYLFNSADIVTITHRGYADYEDVQFLDELEKEITAQEN